MEEADGILFLSLRQVECAIPDSVTTVAEVTSAVLVSIVSRCLSLITEGEADFPSTYEHPPFPALPPPRALPLMLTLPYR